MILAVKLNSKAVNWLIALFSVLLFVSLAEWGARSFYTPRLQGKGGNFEPDPEKVFRLRPDAHPKDPGIESFETNSRGYRDNREFAPLPPSGKKRLLLAGDSIAFGYRVRLADTFARRLEALAPVEVVNTSVPGNSTFQEFFDLQRGLDLHPDALLLQFTLNDVTEPFAYIPRFGGYSPEHIRVRDLTALHSALLQASMAYTWLDESVLLLQQKIFGAAYLRDRATRLEVYNEKYLMEHPDSPEIGQAWAFFFGWMEKIDGLCKAARVPCLLMPSPYRFQLLAAPGAKDIFYPHERLRAFAESHGWRFFDPTAALLARMREGRGLTEPQWNAWLAYATSDEKNKLADLVLLDHNHLTSEGHRVLAEALAKFLKNAKLTAY